MALAEGIVREQPLLTTHPDYFLLMGGLERALYRIARKHVGLQRGGWSCCGNVAEAAEAFLAKMAQGAALSSLSIRELIEEGRP